MKIKNTTELREMLLDTIEEVKTDKLGVKEANAVAALTSKIIQTVKLDMQMLALSKKAGVSISNGCTPLIGR